MSILGITFLNPEYFVLLSLVLVVVFVEFGRKKHGLKFKFLDDVRKIYPKSSLKFYINPILKIIVLSLFIIILANPSTSNTKQEETRNGIDIALVLDISKSMLAEDITPNRIEAAKNVITDFISRLKSDRLAITIFAGKPFVSVPLTFDYDALKEFTKNITTDSVNQNQPGLSGTAIGDGLLSAIDTLEQRTKDEKREKIIILVTDGAANVGVNPDVAAKLAKEKGIKIYSIGIGIQAGTPLFVTDTFGNKQYFRDAFGNPISADLDEKTLKNISSTTGGEYYLASNSDTMNEIFRKLSTLNKSEIKVQTIKEFSPIYFPFLILLLLMISLTFWSESYFMIRN